jgi:hypothetical protein
MSKIMDDPKKQMEAEKKRFLRKQHAKHKLPKREKEGILFEEAI